MNKVKNAVALILVAILVFSVAACGKNEQAIETQATTNPTEVYFENTVNFTPDNTINNTVINTVDNTTVSTVINNVSQPAETFTQGAQTNNTTSNTPVTESTTHLDQTQAPPTQSNTTPPTQAAPETQPTQPPQQSTPTSGYGSYTTTYQGVNQIVFYPASADASADIFPVVVFANGTGFDYKIYEKLLIAIAQSGFIVVANSETMAADGTAQRASLDFIITENNNTASVLYKNINTQKIAAAGHSQGGRSAVNAAVSDSRFACVISLAGSNYTEEAEKLSTPALFMAGTMDMIVNANQWVKPAYDVCKGPAVYVSLVNGIHTSCCTNPETYIPYITKWLNIWLNGDSAAKVDFRAGGQLSQDSAWTEFSSKGI